MKAKSFSINRPCYTLASSNGIDAELTMYGEIYESQPTDWWGDPIEGSFILQDEFLRDLDAVKNCKSLSIRINSAGGDAAVAVLIHNRLRELAANGTKLSCTVDGIAMSGGSLIMCACDTVRVYPSSIVMIHKGWSFLFGGYNADEMRDIAGQLDAVDRAQVGIYVRKTGLSETQLLHMMGDTTYMTGRDAIDKGFADELLDGDVKIAASADGRTIFAEGREMHLAGGMFAPDFVPTMQPDKQNDISGRTPDDISPEGNPAGPDPSEPGDPGSTAEQTAERREIMTLEELRVQNPELANQIDAERTAAVQEAENRARTAERQRLHEIDEIASTIGDPAMLEEARYGETACDAHELAYRAARASAAKGGTFLTLMQADAKASGTGNVAAVPAPADPKPEGKTSDEMINEARQIVADLGISSKTDKQ